MSIELNHIIVHAKDKWTSAEFLAGILGLRAGPPWAHFVPVVVSNGVTLDYCDSEDVRPTHYAFLVSDAEFDAALDRLRSAGIEIYSEHDRTGPGEFNRFYGGRGVYFDDPNGHVLELITKPYGAAP